MKHPVIIALALICRVSAAAHASPAPFEIGEAVSSAPFWETTFQSFERLHREHGFTATGDGADCADSCLDGAVTCFGLPVYETRVFFAEDGGAVSRVELMLYAKAGVERYVVRKGMDGKWRKFGRSRVERPMSTAEFNGTLEKVRARLTPQGAKPPQMVKTGSNSGTGVHEIRNMQTWPRTSLPYVATLTSGISRLGGKSGADAPGFIRLSFDGPATLAARQSGIGAKSQRAALGGKSLLKNIVRTRAAEDGRGIPGDVFIDGIPMVDQGRKGYCAAAASERVLRYYGLDIDEHMIAQTAGTTADGGTSSTAMRDSVAAVGRRFRLANVVAYGGLDKSVHERVKNFLKEVEAYNKTARRLKRREIPSSVYLSGHNYDQRAFDEAVEPDVLMELKCRGPQRAKCKKFISDVRQQVDKGIPLFWGVTLGIFPEKGIPQSRGGHMRLIIGYNGRTNEIIYSDSWGQGHEFKRMPSDQAFAISHSLMYLKPLR